MALDSPPVVVKQATPMTAESEALLSEALGKKPAVPTPPALSTQDVQRLEKSSLKKGRNKKKPPELSLEASFEEPTRPKYIHIGSPARIKREASNVARTVVSAFQEMGAKAIARRPDKRVIKDAQKAGRHARDMHDALNDDDTAEGVRKREAALAAASRP